ncbi:hypothetical protein PInf_008081 [Phytophthora infestans]|nr:hypothetical protein PInf_008081 [Phytophthora infestans]
MTSMSLSFILCESDEESAPRTRRQRKKREGSSVGHQADAENISSAEKKNPSSVARRPNKGGSSKKKRNTSTTAPERQHRVRQLQNMRQRRYRERKKSTASALQVKTKELHQENGALETAILKHFKSQK